jgi:FixJ family two-component response regulator
MLGEPTVFVVDDDEAVRDSMRLLLESVHLRVATFASASEFLTQYASDRPGCLLLDARLPDIDGLELQALLTERHISLPVIMISGHGDVSMAVRAMKAGALDFFEKPYNGQILLDRIREAIRCDQDLSQLEAEINAVCARRASLTPRENEILDHIAAGDSTKEIAKALDLSTKTVEGHRTRLMEKMEAQTVAALVRMALMSRCRAYPQHGGVVFSGF